MWSLSARDEVSLRDVSGAVHDAYVDGPIEVDDVAGVVVVPFLQEGFDAGPPSEEILTGQTWRYREYRVSFFRGRLLVRRVREVHETDHDFSEALMIVSVDFVEQANEVHVCGTTESLGLVVDGLDVLVELSSDLAGHVRRRVGRLTGIVSDKWLDQQMPARSTWRPQ
jgi:hypothetical protein